MNIINSINKSNWYGLILSIFLTFIPFYIIQNNCFENKILFIITIFCSIIQIYVHLIYFLHLKHNSYLQWNCISLIFTIFIVFVLILGSIWIMTHLHTNLMSNDILNR